MVYLLPYTQHGSQFPWKLLVLESISLILTCTMYHLSRMESSLFCRAIIVSRIFKVWHFWVCQIPVYFLLNAVLPLTTLIICPFRAVGIHYTDVVASKCNYSIQQGDTGIKHTWYCQMLKFLVPLQALQERKTVDSVVTSLASIRPVF